MIDDRMLIFVIMIVLTYLFDHKVIPQIGVIAIGMFQIYTTIGSISVEEDGLYFFLYIIALLYCVFMIAVAPEERDEDMYL